MSPVFGLLVDKTGKNIIWVLCAVAATLVSHMMLAFTMWNPWIAMVTFVSPGLGSVPLRGSVKCSDGCDGDCGGQLLTFSVLKIIFKRVIINDYFIGYFLCDWAHLGLRAHSESRI